MAENIDEVDGILVTLATPDHFLLCKESLTRIGIANVKDKKLVQSVLILHKRGQYYICHFKSLFKLDGKPATITEEDYARRNLIAKLLEDWGLLKIEERECLNNVAPINSVKIISHSDKKNWTLIQKFTLGSDKLKRKGK